MDHRERRIIEIAGARENVITREQMASVGLGPGAIAYRVRSGRYRRLHRGVYFIAATPPTRLALAWAAVLACGPAAAVSHRSAAEIWQLLAPADEAVEITVWDGRARSHPTVRVHRAGLPDWELRRLRGLPLTSPARTVFDLAAAGRARDAQEALNEGRARRLVTDGGLRSVLARAGTGHGTALTRAMLEHDGFTRSEAERRLAKLVRDADLPLPCHNARARGFEVDLLWPRERLVLEVDGHAAHGHRSAFERDRLRDQTLVAAGYRVIRVTWRQLTDQPLMVVARIAQALAAGNPG